MALRKEDGKEFTLAQALTITTGALMCEDIGDVYKVLNYMAGESLFTHALPRVIKECRPYVLQWYPELDIDVNALGVNPDTWHGIMTGLEAKHGKTRILWTIPMDDHDVIDPIEEAQAMMGDDGKVITIDITEEDEISPYGEIS